MDVGTLTLAEALAQARQRYHEANPASHRAHDEATAAMPGGNTRSTLYFSPFPLTMTGGAGCWMTDLDGHRYLDLLGEYTAGLYGHNHPVIRQAVEAALDGGWNLGARGLDETALAELLCARFPSVELVRFTNSGTEANLMALATALLHTDRRSVLVFDGAYHGSVLSFGGGGQPVNVPHRWVVGTYNDLAGTERWIEEYAAGLAAILVEPMLGSGGCVPADPAFLRMLRRGADDSGAVLIFDEVMTSRMSVGGMQHRLGITPDLTTLGKYLGGGMTFGAFGGRRELMSVYDPSSPGAVQHPGTFNNNVFSMTAGYAGLSRLFPAEASEALFRRGERLRHELNALSARAGTRLQWTGMGSLLTAHFQAEPISAARDIRPADELRELFHLDMLDRGCYLARRGMVALSLEIGDAEYRMFRAAVEDFLTERRALLAT
ncbi:aspartate aminotransferase family protein [Jatrophihabitans sp.]|uniref:aspartate aminotransferase family protein n=1 Tax=Jatrophihabitans sp. TaxID=1932789 RepID=UPI002BDA856D|nr:aminotransferase class III-fold pyridoxal phosphate-dependent enzyme [Jatrophihabitans sp.]